jgi:hypothetical protein
MERDPATILQVKFDVVWAIATEKVVLLLEQLEPLLPQPPNSGT